MLFFPVCMSLRNLGVGGASQSFCANKDKRTDCISMARHVLLPWIVKFQKIEFFSRVALKPWSNSTVFFVINRQL